LLAVEEQEAGHPSRSYSHVATDTLYAGHQKAPAIVVACLTSALVLRNSLILVMSSEWIGGDRFEVRLRNLPAQLCGGAPES